MPKRDFRKLLKELMGFSDQSQFFRKLLDVCKDLSGAEEGGILVRNSETEALRIEESDGEGLFKKKILQDPNESICVYAANHQKSINISDIKQISNKKNGYKFHQMSDAEIKSELVIPILYNEECEGVINLESTRTNAFSAETEDMLNNFASEIALLFHANKINIAKNYLAKELTSLQDITSLIINHLETPEIIYSRILSHSLELTEATIGGILLLSDDGEYLEIKSSRHLKKHLEKSSEPVKLKRGEGIVWLSVNEKRVRNICDVDDYKEIYADLSESDSEEEIHSELTAPLMYQDEVFGVINIESDQYSGFGLEHEQTLERFAQQISILYQIVRVNKQWKGAWAMSKWGDMTSNIAHKMKNQLTPLNIISKRLEKRLVDEKSLEMLGTIKQTSNELLVTIERYQQIFERKSNFVDVCEAIGKVVKQSASKISANIELKSEIMCESITVKAQQAQFEELCEELILNSAKALINGGEIVVRLYMNWGKVIFEVKDSGPGFNSSDPEIFFKQGFQGSKERPGSGYGLWWAQQFIHALGGEIKVKSRPEGGGWIQIILPTLKNVEDN